MLFNLFTMLNLKILHKGFCSNAKGSSQPFNYDNPKALQMATVLQSISSLLVKDCEDCEDCEEISSIPSCCQCNASLVILEFLKTFFKLFKTFKNF